MKSRTCLVLCLLRLFVSPSLQCTITYVDLNMSSNDTSLLNSVAVRSMIECSVNCASQNCVSVSFDTQTKMCTTYSNDNHNETGNDETGNFTTSYRTITMSRSYSDLADCRDLCCTDCSGVYRITPVPGTSFDVFCDTETTGGPWTVIQRRFDGSVNFYRNWEEYKWGFGNLDGEHWLGLEYMYSLLSLGQQLYIYLEGWDGTTGYASYQKFVIGDETSNYQLTLGEFSGNVEESFIRPSPRAFSTYDSDNDISPTRHCAEFGKGGWWYKNCYSVNLNGLHTVDQGIDVPASMNWKYFYRDRRQAPLRKSIMMVKRKG